jgi:hypothetical protein
LPTKSSCSTSSTWAKSIPPVTKIQKKLLDHQSWETRQGKRYLFAGRHRELEMGLDGLLVMARTSPSPPCASSIPRSRRVMSGRQRFVVTRPFSPSSPWPPSWTCSESNHKGVTRAWAEPQLKTKTRMMREEGLTDESSGWGGMVKTSLWWRRQVPGDRPGVSRRFVVSNNLRTSSFKNIIT